VATEYPSLSLANLGDTFNVQEALFPLVSAGFGHSQGVEVGLTNRGEGPWYGQLNLSLSKARYARSTAASVRARSTIRLSST